MNFNKIIAWTLLFLAVFVIVAFSTGCSDRFRYPCQDPANWGSTECKRPACAVTSTCPDQLTRPEDRNKEE